MAHLIRRLLGATVMLSALGCESAAQRGARGPLPACEWCGAPEAPSALLNTMSLAGPDEPGVRLVVTGTMYWADGRTPAAGVLLYAYHTNAAGVYPDQDAQTGNGRRHGALRGWLRTDTDGRYRIETIKPGPYPGRTDPMHIHLTVTPPGGEERWIDEIEFEGDPRLTPEVRARREGLGGPGIVALRDSGGVLRAVRDIVLREDPPRRARALGSVAAPATRSAAARRTDSIDLTRSTVRWKGTKFRGRGSHEGLVRLASGTLTRCGTAVCGGSFEIDMTTIQVTDIPASDPVPRRNLTQHLEGDDFFAVARHPRAHFALDTVRAVVHPDGTPRAGRHEVRGRLTLRGNTQSVAFPASVTRCGESTCVEAAVRIDRRRWGITYRFDPVRNLIVDDTIAIDLHLVVPAHDAGAS